MSTRIEAPFHLHTNAIEVIEAGIEDGGAELLAELARRIGRADLAEVDLLDVGCGVRFTQTIINRSIPIRSYTGIEVKKDIVEWLTAAASSVDERFRFAHWNVYHSLYNQAANARPMAEFEALPVPGSYDVITGFSLFTHMLGDDAATMLKLMRKAVRPGGLDSYSFRHCATILR